MFFKDRRTLRALFGILTSVLFFLVVFISGPVLSVENSDSAKNLIPAVLKNHDVTTSFSNQILKTITDNTTGPLTDSINSKHAEFVSAVSGALSSPTTIAELQKDVGVAYTFLTTNQPSITIQVKPLVASLISAMSSVDPQFKDTKLVLKDIKPITLTRDSGTPQIGNWLSLGRNLYVALIILLALALFFFLRFSANGKRALRAVGTRVLFVGVLSIVQFFAIAIIASKLAKNATDATIKTVIPVAARALFSYYQSIGIALVVAGAVAILVASRLNAPTEKLVVVPELAYAPE